ncbi:GYF domain-containing protein [Bradyrhizobium sp. 6(2017)]|uniref:GYF domain-containing protein n=1 Tax=Bradyrhizobium sp. 6(2017) TaxID=1197460 RepID=UPI0013E15CBE|nr:DUF4339 domain-containing protein [Bradyrhizobium sp. 6(2017)]
MEAVWWYSDRFGQVGPFTLEQLRDVLSTFDERRTSEVLVWCQGFSDWKAPDILNDFREQDDVVPPQEPGASRLLAQATAAIIGAGKSYWTRLANEFLRDKRDRMRTKALRATLRLPAEPGLPPPLPKFRSVLLLCPTCRRPVSSGANSCPRCGEPLTQEWEDRELERLERAKSFGKSIGNLVGASIVALVVLFAVVASFIGERDYSGLQSMTQSEFRARRSDICAMTALRGLSMDDERALRKACFGP